MSENKNKNERHFCLLTHFLTKLSQNVCLINMHIFLYWHARCDCKLYHVLWLYCVFFLLILAHNQNHSCLNFCIIVKLSQTICLIDTHNLVYQNARYDCRLWKFLWINCVFFGIFIYYYMFKTLYFHQTLTNYINSYRIPLYSYTRI